MPYKPKKDAFDINDFIESLLKKMHLNSAPAYKKNELAELLKSQVSGIILNTASLYLEPHVIDKICDKYRDEKDPFYFMRQLISASPKTQRAILEELDRFYDHILLAHKELAKN